MCLKSRRSWEMHIIIIIIIIIIFIAIRLIVICTEDDFWKQFLLLNLKKFFKTFFFVKLKHLKMVPQHIP